MNFALVFLSASLGAIYFTEAMLGPFYAVYVEKIGGGLEVAGGAVALLAFISGLVTLWIGKWENKFKETENALVIGYFIQAIGFAGYLFISRPWQLFVISGILGLGNAVIFPAVDALFARHIDRARDVAQWSWWEVMENWGGALGALLGGFIAGTFGFRAVFIIMAVIMTINALFILILPRRIL